VASESHRNPKDFDLQEFGVYKEFGFKETVSVYGVNKMYLVSFANELARREANVHIRALCPGPVNTKIAREAPKLLKPLLNVIFGLFFRSPDIACEPIVYFAAEPNPNKGFDYLFLMTRADIDEKTSNKENAKLLWKRSEKIINEIDREI
jgi:NAD(P)-dependent dehydrogenase (short-subunit alcohol dehydrogenase family)